VNKISVETKEKILKGLRMGISNSKLSKTYGVSLTTIYLWKSGKKYKPKSTNTAPTATVTHTIDISHVAMAQDMKEILKDIRDLKERNKIVTELLVENLVAGRMNV